jgi:serine/threonine-protein kinase
VQPILDATDAAIDVRPPPSEVDDAATIPHAKVGEQGTLEIGSSAFIQELGPPTPSAQGASAALVGKLISGRYRVDEILGQGGLGAVFGGEQVHLRKRVAIKVLRPDTEQKPGFLERFEREAVAGAHIHHPNVAAAIDFGELEDGSHFLVTEYVEGMPLSQVLAAGPLAPARALRIARQMAEALAAVHAKGILHRDIKPQNTLLAAGDHVKIIDFGLAKVDIASTTGKQPAAPPVPLTGLGVVFGTLAYLAPEAEGGMGAVDARSDLYALGVTLYEMLCGLRPFVATDRTALFLKQRTEDPPAISARAPEITVPAAAEQVAMRLVQRAPAARYQDAHEVVKAIDEALQALGGPLALPAVPAVPQPEVQPAPEAPQPPHADEEDGPPPTEVMTGWRRRRGIVLAVAVGSLLLGGLVVVLVRAATNEEDDVPVVPLASARATNAPTASAPRVAAPAPSHDSSASAPATSAAAPARSAPRAPPHGHVPPRNPPPPALPIPGWVPIP